MNGGLILWNISPNSYTEPLRVASQGDLTMAQQTSMRTKLLANSARRDAATEASSSQSLAQPGARRNGCGNVEESIAKSDGGKAKVDRVAAAVGGVTAEAGQVKTRVDEVNVGSQEQARGLEQIGKAITQMEQSGQTTAGHGGGECGCGRE
jgi:methyl-accepting chemotaxis protein